MLELTGFGSALRAIGMLYWLIAVAAIGFEIWKGKTIRAKVLCHDPT